MNLFNNKNLHIYLTAMVVIFIVVIGSFYIVKGQTALFSSLNDDLIVKDTVTVQLGTKLNTLNTLYALLIPNGRVGIGVETPSVELEVNGDLLSNGTGTFEQGINVAGPTVSATAGANMVVVAGSTCPTGAKLAKKYMSKTCTPNDSACLSCTIDGDWLESSALNPTCIYEDTAPSDQPGDCSNTSLICTATVVESVLCITK